MPGRSEGRAVLVTGRSRGISAAIARRFAADGDRVAVHFLASPAAEFASGTILDLNGASYLRT